MDEEICKIDYYDVDMDSCGVEDSICADLFINGEPIEVDINTTDSQIESICEKIKYRWKEKIKKIRSIMTENTENNIDVNKGI